MKIAFIIYDGVTTLDFIGVFDPITRLKTMNFIKDIEYDVCALKEKIISQEGLEIVASKIKNNLFEYDYVIIPGGNGIKELINNNCFIDWIKGASAKSILASVCGGSLLLGVAGLLKDREATTHPMLMEWLKKFTTKVSNKRIVEDGNIISARGVTSSLDLGLYLSEKIAGKEVREKIQAQMDYISYKFD